MSTIGEESWGFLFTSTLAILFGFHSQLRGRRRQNGSRSWILPLNAVNSLHKFSDLSLNCSLGAENPCRACASTAKTCESAIGPEKTTEDKITEAPELELYKSTVQLRTQEVVPGKGPPPELPTTCCQSGCANCVWIRYAEEVAKYYKDGGAKARDAIKQIEDPNLRAFVMLEISDVLR